MDTQDQTQIYAHAASTLLIELSPCHERVDVPEELRLVSGEIVYR